MKMVLGVLNVEVRDTRRAEILVALPALSPLVPKTGRNGEARSQNSLVAREKRDFLAATFTT